MKFSVDVHCHSISSGHAYSTISECAAEAARKKLELLAITDHAPSMEGAPSSFHFGNLNVLPERMYGVELLRGVELNILDTAGDIDLSPRLLSELDIAIASLHPPVIRPDTAEDYTETLLAVINNPWVDILGHLDDPRYHFDIARVAEAASRTRTIIELNNSSLRPKSSRRGGGEVLREIIRRCVEARTPMVLGSDAHFHADVGNFCYLEPILDELSVPEELVLNTSAEKLKSALRQRRKQFA